MTNYDDILAKLSAELQAATGREVYVDLDRTPIFVIPAPYTGATQQDWPVKATEKEPAMDVTITQEEYLRLLEASLMLEALEDAGVDNWPGRDYVDHGAIQDAMAGARAALKADQEAAEDEAAMFRPKKAQA